MNGKVRSICCGPTSTTPCIGRRFQSSERFIQHHPRPTNNCVAPLNPTSSNATQNSVKLTWNTAPNACYYAVYYTSELTTQPAFMVIRVKEYNVGADRSDCKYEI